MSDAEADKLNNLVEISGLTKQDYLIHRVLQEDVVINGNPRVFKSLKQNMNQMIEELQKIQCDLELSEEKLEWIERILILFEKLNQNWDQVQNENMIFFGM